MSISAVVATKNSARTIEECLGSLRGFSKVVVVDGSSKDATLGIARTHGVEVRDDGGAGFFGAYDMGFRATESEYVMFLDSDAYLEDFDFAAALSHFADPRVGMVVCLAHAPVTGTLSKLMNDVWFWRMSQIRKYTGGSAKASWLDRQYSRFFMSESLHSGSTSTGPCYIMRREAILEMGGIDARADDFVLKRLLERKGYATRFYASASVYHITRPNLRKLLGEYIQFGLRGAQIARQFYSTRERAAGMAMFCLSVATAPFIAKDKRDPRHLVFVPLLRGLQMLAFLVGSLADRRGRENYGL